MDDAPPEDAPAAPATAPHHPPAPASASGAVWDLAELVHQRDRAQQVRDRLERMAETLGLGLIVRRLDGRPAEWNASKFRLCGRPVEHGVPSREEYFRRYVHPQDRESPMRVSKMLQEGTVSSMALEYRIVRDDGSVRWLAAWSQREDDGGQPAIFSFYLDVTGQRAAELALQQERERARFATESAGIGVWERELDGAPRYWSAQMYRLRGLRPGDPRPLAILQALGVDGADAPGLAVTTGLPDREFAVTWPDGSRHWLAERGQTVHDAQGTAQYLAGITIDVTERHRAEAARLEAEQARAASRAKSDFTARMSHELRTPLNAVLGFTQLMLQPGASGLPPHQADRARLVLEAGQHLLALIDDLLELSQVEADAMVLNQGAVLLAPLVQRTLQWIAPAAHEGAVTLESGPLEGSVHGDARRVQQILSNLLSNAVKYNRRGGSVHVEVLHSLENGCRGLRVRDTGRGLEPTQLQHLFEPFNRLGAERDGIAGTGIGLNIAVQLARRMNGRLEVHSDPGHGSAFTLWLPACENAAAMALAALPGLHSTADPTPAAADAPAYSLLYIEDDAVNRLLVSEVLGLRPRLRLHTAETGKAGLQVVRELQPQIVLIDLHLPDISGHEVLRRLRADPALRTTRCIALSANVMADDIASALADGFDEYWTKPIDVVRFLGAVDRLVARAAAP